MAKLNPLLLALGIPVAVIGFVAAVLLSRQGGKFADLPQFSPETYRKDWATLQGNAYRLDCKVEQQLAYVEGKGRVLAVKPTDDSRGGGRIPIFVPAGSGDSFEVGQRFRCRVRVSQDLLVVEGLERF